MSAPVAIAVVSFNTLELLRACLRSLEADADSGRADVWVVDNASTDGSAAAVEREFGWVKLIANKRNVGFGAAVNMVAERTENEWIAPANADIELTPGALERLLEAGLRDPRAGLLAPRLETLDGNTQHSVHSFPTVTLSLALQLGIARVVPGLGDRLCLERGWDSGRPRRVDWAHGAFLLLRRLSFERVGGFDAEQWMYAEDLDLAWRLDQDNWHSRYEPAATVRHAVSAAAAEAFGDERRARYMAASYAWMMRRRGRIATWAFALVNLLGSTLRWLALAPAALIRPQRFAGRRAEVGRWMAMHARGLRSRRALLADPRLR